MDVSYNVGCDLQQPRLFVRQAADLNTQVMKLGDRVKFARKHRGLTQATLGKLVGASQQAIQKLERGGETSALLPKIARACGVSIDWLDTETGSPFVEPPRRKPVAEADDITLLKFAVIATLDFLAKSQPGAGPAIAARFAGLSEGAESEFAEVVRRALTEELAGTSGRADPKSRL
jgi:transcriptional regulator with XRE-family HTH domain